MSDDLCFTPATELADRIRSGNLSPVTLVDAFLDRIDRVNDRLTAYVTVCEESARSEAVIAEQAVERGDKLGQLHGIPIAIKDLTRVKGVRTTFGSPSFAEHTPTADDTVVTRLRDAGAIILGKTNTPEFGRKTVTENPIFGASTNPWDLTRTTGGSSGGSAAAVAAGLAPLALGSDAAGSIRIPSSACGVYGLMPDFGRVPHGSSNVDAYENCLPYTYLGPIARTVGDAALMLDVITGPDVNDPFSLPQITSSYQDSLEGDISNLSIGYSVDFGASVVSTEVQNAIESALKHFSDTGATVEPANVSFEGTWEERHDALELILQSRYVGLYENLKRDSDVDLLADDIEVTPEVRSRIQKGLQIGTRELAEARRVRTSIFREVQEVVSQFDILATPTLGRTAFELNTDHPTVDGVSVHPMHGWTLTWLLNLSGNPAGSVPIGFSDEGLPIGMQLIGPRFGDRTVIMASSFVEQTLPWEGSYPPTAIAEGNE
ncbi:amidase [Haladaptatus salinisoli]|uniref:amidase n=1 Tax=Haladaptatus salinisoli TaxID=2884876 RepID=UPI001D0B636E|nr:amidase [Haladaptatus salinisoli]